jgi:DNA-binding MarR family transcriptional regulator
MCWRRVWDHIQARLHAEGFSDLQDSYLPLFQFPGPDAARPSDLARRLDMSRQAINHLIAQLEHLGYVVRREGQAGERRLIYLTERGHAATRTIVGAVRELQEEWATKIGRDEFAVFMGVLKRLAQPDEAGR